MAGSTAQINKIYDMQLNSELAALKNSQQKATNKINQQKKQTSANYYDKRNQADVVNFQNQKRLKELMAASGLGRSGENISGQVGLSAARQQALSGLNRDEQFAMNRYNQQISDINDPFQEQQIRSQISMARSQALLDALERERDRAARRSYGRASQQRPIITEDAMREIYWDAMHERDVQDRQVHPGVLRPYLGTEAYFNKQRRLLNGI